MNPYVILQKYYSSNEEAFASLKKIAIIEPDTKNTAKYTEAFQQWKSYL